MKKPKLKPKAPPRELSVIDQAYVSLCVELGDRMFRLELIPSEIKEIKAKMEVLRKEKEAAAPYWQKLQTEKKP